MAEFYIRNGDLLPAIEVTLYRDRKVANLTGATAVTLNYRPKVGGAVVTKTGAFVGALTDGKVKYAWAANDTDTAGEYEAYWRVTYVSGEQESFPNNGFFTMAFTEDL